MKNPYLLAWLLNLAAFGAIWMYVHARFRLTFRVYFVVAATCMPLPVSFAGYFWFLGDFIGIALLSQYLLGPTLKGERSNNFGSSVIGLFSVGLVAWPLVSTYLAVTRLNETAPPSTVAFFVLRSAAQIGFFSWALRTGNVVRSVKPLMAIPAAFWVLFASLGILQFAGGINVDAFWYLNSDFRPSVLYPSAETLQHESYMTSGFMGMDKPQLALWSSYGTCIALWLFASDSGALGFLAMTIPILSGVIVLTIGSRQGLLGVSLATACTALLVGPTSIGKFRLIRLTMGLVAAALIGPLVWNSIDGGRREWMLSHFEQLENISSFDELARKRDASIPDLIAFICDQPQRLYFGSGVGTESADGQNAEGIRTYAEGEYLRILWSGGLISLLSYAAVLFLFLRHGIRGLSCKSRFQRGEAALLLSMTVVGAFFALGQFHLFTTMYHNVPCNYLLMMTSGLLGGAVTRSCSADETPKSLYRASYGAASDTERNPRSSLREL